MKTISKQSVYKIARKHGVTDYEFVRRALGVDNTRANDKMIISVLANLHDEGSLKVAFRIGDKTSYSA